MYTLQNDGTLFVKEFIGEGQFLLAVLDTEKPSGVGYPGHYPFGDSGGAV